MPSPTPAAAANGFRPPNIALTTLGLALASFMQVLDLTIANVSLPTISGNLGVDRIEFVAHAKTPMRVSVQIRLPGGPGGHRWRRSVYLDETPRTFSLPLRDFESAERQTTLRPNVARVQTVLFVVDTLNAMPGNEGTIWIFDPKVGVGGEARSPTSSP